MSKDYCSTRESSRATVRILNIPPTSASCERNWKAFSDIKRKKTNRLTGERTAKLVLVSQKLHLINNDNIMLSNSDSDHDLLKEHTDTESSLSSSNSDLAHPMLSSSESDSEN